MNQNDGSTHHPSIQFLPDTVCGMSGSRHYLGRYPASKSGHRISSTNHNLYVHVHHVRRSGLNLQSNSNTLERVDCDRNHWRTYVYIMWRTGCVPDIQRSFTSNNYSFSNILYNHGDCVPVGFVCDYQVRIL